MADSRWPLAPSRRLNPESEIQNPESAALSPLRTSARTLVVLWLLILAYTIFMSALSIRQHDAFLTHKADLGHFDQAVWNTLHGRPFVRTQQGEQLTRLTDHVEPILVPLSLVFLLWDDVRALLVLQSVAVALGALPVFWLARDELRKSAANPIIAEVGGLILALVYLLFPALQAANLTEFHAAPFVVTPMLLALYYARQGRYGRMWLWALLVMAVKEEMPLLTFMLGLWLIAFRRRRAHGLALAAVSLAWFGVATFAIVPHFAPLKYGVEESIYFQRYGELGDSPFAVAKALVTRPALVWRIATEPARLGYLGGLLASAGLVLPLLAPEILLLSLPSLLANLLSGYEAMYSGVYHYSAPVVPFFVAAAAVGLARVLGFGFWILERRRLNRKPKIQTWAAVGLVGLLLLCSLVYHRARGHTPLALGFAWPRVTAHHRLLEERFAPQIPDSAVLSTTAPLFPHLDHRERIHQFPLVEDAEWVLLDAGSFAEMHPADLRRAYDDLIAGQTWCIVDAADGYLLLNRRDATALEGAACQRELPDAFYDFVRVQDPDPQYRIEADFGGQVRLLGYDVIEVPQWRRVGVRLYWRRSSEPDPLNLSGLQPYVFWLGEGGAVVGTSAEYPLVEVNWYPPERWHEGEVIVTEMLPWDIGPAFRLGLAVQDAGGRRLPVELPAPAGSGAYGMEGGSWLRLQAFRWQKDGRLLGFIASPQARRVVAVDEGFEALAAGSPAPSQAVFGGRIALAGFELEPDKPRPGGQLRLRLSWSGLSAPSARNYTLFVHLLDTAGNRVAQGDGMPNYLGALPTTLWRPGLAVLDEHLLLLPPELVLGDYRLLIGWYDPETGERLALEGGADSLELAAIRVW